ncbi:MAG: nickel pincer cofactor biosynthesis protein LarC [Proteobacteria bacterium]|nr:nickel pincer cofactor biosynthesis protein LarC [Pseudomonadota bacterium]MCG2829538.1 nickel pincer cofactor biosynthesis protein LarC [Desulfobacteraceae bacterium]MBU4208733.1 nickel pincer cofactor biosynthesis protein LarC [Pseudomonadota bacterium]MBU4389156.1 nickel pincer cofactor biosynthesis protein LarC [Pseudomonadota bacterium]MBU4420928.1 nickel pincer cofactor biosynthesis protein LarC [Pseudomonadota bacterium]
MIAYFDCFCGISGDMTLGAFIDIGVPLSWLKDSLTKIPLKDFDLSAESISRSGIKAQRVHVITKNTSRSRHYAEIKDLVKNSPLPKKVKEKSLEIFERLAIAEAEIHGQPKEKVHFHELGGIDAIVDIVGTALCLEYLSIEKVVASKIPLGNGFVSCRHGTLPVPAPATLSILKGTPVYGTEIPYELVTPTGAAIITSLADSFGNIPDMIVEKTGYGAGKRELKTIPNLLRIIIGTSANHMSDYQKDRISVVETCIDDMNPEFFGFVMDRLFEEGALDVYLIPVVMKKNRPGTMMQVLCMEDRKKSIINRILSETTSLGVRYYDVQRTKLVRENITIKTSYGNIQVKRVKDPSGSVRLVPEYEVCKKIALEKKIPLKTVYDTIIKETAAI